MDDDRNRACRSTYRPAYQRVTSPGAELVDQGDDTTAGRAGTGANSAAGYRARWHGAASRDMGAGVSASTPATGDRAHIGP